MGLKAAAFLWGLAEATLFFIVPDVLLTAVAIQRSEGRDQGRLALQLCLWVLGGALVGGLAMYLWGRQDYAAARELLLGLPAIGEAMVDRVGQELEQTGALAVLLGPTSGTPYKLYAITAPSAGMSLPIFLAITVPARLVRFVLAALLTAWIGARLPERWSNRARLGLLAGFWALNYAVYFWVMPWH